MLRVRIGFLVICRCLLPEGAEPLPYVSADSLCGFAWESANFWFSPRQHAMEAAPYERISDFCFSIDARVIVGR